MERSLLACLVVFSAGCGCDFWSHGACVQLAPRMMDWPDVEHRIDMVLDTALEYCGGDLDNWVIDFRTSEIECDMHTSDVSGCTQFHMGQILIEIDSDDCLEDEAIIHEVCHASRLRFGHSSGVFDDDRICELWMPELSRHGSCMPRLDSVDTWDHQSIAYCQF